MKSVSWHLKGVVLVFWSVYPSGFGAVATFWDVEKIKQMEWRAEYLAP